MGQVNQMNVFEFSSFVLDPNTVRLLKQGRAIEVEPQVFQTLLLLVKNSERVVTKDELMQAVWSGRLVTDNVITRTIYKIRKIIDSADDSQSMIRTVRGNGYQFIAEVKIQTVLYNSKIEAATETNKGALKQVFLLILVVLLGMALWHQNNQKLKLKIPVKVNASYQIVAVLPINVEGGSEELSILTQSVVDYLATQLALNLRMKVIHPDSMLVLKDQLSDIWSIQQATRAKFIIDGFLESVSDTLIKLHLTLYKKNDKDELIPYSLGSFEFPYPHTTKDLNDLYKQRKITVKEIISLINPGVVINDEGETETDDPEAYRMVIAAHHIMRSDSCPEIYRAEELLINATERDPGFAHAWNQLFSNYFKRIWVCGESTDNYQKALKVAEIEC